MLQGLGAERGIGHRGVQGLDHSHRGSLRLCLGGLAFGHRVLALGEPGVDQVTQFLPQGLIGAACALAQALPAALCRLGQIQRLVQRGVGKLATQIGE